MPLHSYLFEGDAALNAAQEQDFAHVVPGATGAHVLKLQMALEVLDGAAIPESERSTQSYGAGTAAAVLAYKTARSIINPAFQAQPDNIVGKMTIQRMDDDLTGKGASRDQMMATAHARSRQSLRSAQLRLQNLQTEINQVTLMPEPEKSGAIASLLVSRARDILVLSRRLLVSADPLSAQFGAALQTVLRLIQDNLAQPLTIMDGGAIGRCAAATADDVPFAATSAGDADPRVSLCNPFFSSGTDLQRDVMTHEYFHLLGLADVSPVTNTSEALANANTLAQVVALLFDRFRQRNSDGQEPAVPAFPSP